MHPKFRRGAAVTLALLLVATLAPGPSVAAPETQSLPATLEAPAWAVGFNWTYRYVGPYYERIGEGSTYYEASFVNDTYTSTVVGQLATPSGPAWLVRNDHAGTMAGNVTAPVIGRSPATAVFTTVTHAAVLKSDYALVNFTQDYNITASGIPIIGTVSGSGHNETQATPPLGQVAWGTPADGTLWRVVTNLTSTGWYQIGSSGQQPTSGNQTLDYNMSVKGTGNVTVPAGTFEAYNISGTGTSNANGNARAFNESFLWSPLVQNKVIDEGGYLLLDYFVNRPPELVGTMPVVNLTSGEGTDVDLTGLFSDPEGNPFTISCAAPAGLQCSVGPGNMLNITSNPGLNATFNLTLTADDGLPAGSASFTMVVLVTGAGSTNMPPEALPHGPLTTPEDTPFHFTVADYFSDPDDGIASFLPSASAPLAIANVTATDFDVVAPQDFNGNGQFSVSVFDFGGLSNASSFSLQVTPVNDPPTLQRVGPDTKTAHIGQNVSASVVGQDVDGDPLTYAWQLDGSPIGTGAAVSFAAALAGAGAHVLAATVDDGQGANASVSFAVLVFVGPQITGMTPSDPQLTIGTGSTVLFSVVAQDPDSQTLDYRWTVNGTFVSAGAGRDNQSIPFQSAGTFTVRATVADNGSQTFVEWEVNVVAVPGGLVLIAAPTNETVVRVNQGSNLTLQAYIDPNLTEVELQWFVNGQPVSREATYGYPVPSSGYYTIHLASNATYLGSIHYSGMEEAYIPVVIVVPSGNGTGNNGTGNNGTGNNGTGNNRTGNNGPPVVPPDNSWMVLLLALVAVAAAVVFYLLLRRRGRDGKK